MARSFHFEDTPPQVFLDNLHKIDVPKLYDSSITSTQRTNLINLTRKRMAEWRKDLRTQMQVIQRRDTSEMTEPYEVPLALAPYKKIDELGSELIKAIDSLEKELKAGRALPKGFGFGTDIFGWYETGEWHIGYREEAAQFETLVYVKNRLDTTKQEMLPMQREIKLANERLKQQKGDLKQQQQAYKKRKSYVRLLIGIIVVMLVGLGSLLAGYIIFTTPEPLIRNDASLNDVIGGCLFAVGTVALLMIVVLIRRRGRAVERLRGEIRQSKRDLKVLMSDAKKLRTDYYPSQQLVKELTKKYRELRGMFSQT